MPFWNKRRDADAEPSQPPPRRLRQRKIGIEYLPRRARPTAHLADLDVLLIASDIHLRVVDPTTEQPWDADRREALVGNSFAVEVTSCHQEAVELSTPEDEVALHWVNRAEAASQAAKHAIDDARRIPDDNTEDVNGAAVTARAVAAEHDTDRSLAAEREVTGDYRHTERPIENAWIVVAAAVFAVLDLLLLWRPVLGLSFTGSAGMVLKWCLAVFFSIGQALFVENVLRRYRERERDSNDRRAAVQDRNRVVRRAVLGQSLPPEPDLKDVADADQRFVDAMYWLLLASALLGLIGAVRVAILSRGSGQSVAEATLFGAVVGLILGGLVLLVGFLSCRGNQLGTRLRSGARLIVDVDRRIAAACAEALAAADVARHDLSMAAAARSRADETRVWVVSAYWQAMLMASGWLGLDAPPTQNPSLTVDRTLPVRDEAERKRGEIERVLADVEEYLATRPVLTPPAPLVAITAGAWAAPGHPTTAVEVRIRPHDKRIIGLEQELPPRRGTPRLLIVAGVVGAVLVSFAAASVAPAPEIAQAIVSAGVDLARLFSAA